MKAFALSVLFLLCGSLVHADEITTFDVFGALGPYAFTDFPGPNINCAGPGFAAPYSCSISGAIEIDVTNGTVVSADLSVPELNVPAFDVVIGTGGAGGLTGINIGNQDGDLLAFLFPGAPGAPGGFGGLVGYTGGAFWGDGFSAAVINGEPYDMSGGFVDPPSPAPGVPEPGTLPLAALGIAALFAGRRRFRAVLSPLATRHSPL